MPRKCTVCTNQRHDFFKNSEFSAPGCAPPEKIEKNLNPNFAVCLLSCAFVTRWSTMQLRYLKTVHQPTPENKDGPKFQKITAIAFSPNHYRLAVATVDRYILLYDENGDLQDRFPTKPAEKTTGPKGYIVRALEFSPDSTRLAVAQSDNIVFVYKLGSKFQDRKSIVNKFQQSAPVTAMCWPINQPNTLAYGSADGKVRIGDLNNNKSIPMYSHDSYVVSMAAGPDGHSLVCAHVDGSIFTYKFEDSDGKFGASHSLLTQVNFVPYALGWGHQICVAGNAGRVQFFDTNGTQRQVFDYSKERDVREFTCAAFNPSGQTVVLGNFNRFHTYAYDAVQGEWHEIAPTRVENMYTMTAVRWKADGSRLVTGSLGGFVDVYDACIRRYVYNGKFEMTYTSPSSAIVRRLSGSGRLELKSAYGCDIRKISVHADRFVLGRTAETLMLADLDTSRVSEIAWSGSGSERFFFDNPRYCLYEHRSVCHPFSHLVLFCLQSVHGLQCRRAYAGRVWQTCASGRLPYRVRQSAFDLCAPVRDSSQARPEWQSCQ
jgi:intraflagellar transport protein 172